MDLLRPRRLLIASGLFAALVLGTVAAAGYQDTSGVPVGPLPASFHLAAAMVGDKGEYTWDHVQVAKDGNVTVLEEHPLLGMEWLAPKPMRDLSGRLHDTNTLHQWGWQRTDRQTVAGATQGASGRGASEGSGWERYAEPVYAIDRNDDTIASYAYISESAADPNQHYGGAHVLQDMLLGPDDHFSPDCGGYSGYQGRDVPLDQDVDLFRACQGFANLFTSNGHAALHAVGTQQIGDRTTVLFASRDGSTDVWLDSSIPFPVRVAVRDPKLDGAYHVLRLTNFSRGTQPIEWGGAPAGSPAPEWVLRPAVSGLPDESGISHPFPASAAVAAARNDPAGKAFSDVLARGYVSFLRYSESLSTGSSERTWEITATDGSVREAVRVDQRTTDSTLQGSQDCLPLPPPAPCIPPPSSAARGPTSTTNVTTQVQATNDPSGGSTPLPDKAPHDLPTVASLWARWQAFASDEYSGMAPNEWGMRIICLPSDCDHPSVGFEGGVDLDQSWTNLTAGGQTSESVRRESVLHESNQDRRGHEGTLRENTYRWHDSQAAPPQSAPMPASGQLTVLHSAAWIAPGAPVVAGSAAVAAFVALAYLLWPTLKSSSLLALFSRHTTAAQVLESPQRSQLLLTVEGEPGLHVRELARRLGWSRSATLHHVGKLQHAGVVTLADAGGYLCVFPKAFDRRDMAAAGATKADAAKRILQLAAERPGVPVREAARVLGLSPGTVSHHLRRLREAGLVRSDALGIVAAPGGPAGSPR